MSILLRRIERLEQHQNARDGLVVVLLDFSDGPLVRATCSGAELLRQDDETEEEFHDRAETWAKEQPGALWGRVVRMVHATTPDRRH